MKRRKRTPTTAGAMHPANWATHPRRWDCCSDSGNSADCQAFARKSLPTGGCGSSGGSADATVPAEVEAVDCSI